MWMKTSTSRHVYCMYIACILHVYCMYIACILHVYYISTLFVSDNEVDTWKPTSDSRFAFDLRAWQSYSFGVTTVLVGRCLIVLRVNITIANPLHPQRGRKADMLCDGAIEYVSPSRATRHMGGATSQHVCRPHRVTVGFSTHATSILMLPGQIGSMFDFH